MKIKIFVTMLCLAFLAGSNATADAVGSSFGTLTTAKAIGQGYGDFGFAVGFADNATSFVGNFAYGLSSSSDGRLKFGLVDPDGGGDTKIVLGADYKWQFWNYGPESRNPFDFAVGGLFEYVDFDGLSVLQIGGFLLASYPIVFENGSTLTPYGRFNGRLESLSLDGLPPGVDDSESNLEIGLNGGVQWQMSNDVGLYAEFQLDGNDGLFVGIDFNVM